MCKICMKYEFSTLARPHRRALGLDHSPANKSPTANHQISVQTWRLPYVAHHEVPGYHNSVTRGSQRRLRTRSMRQVAPCIWSHARQLTQRAERRRGLQRPLYCARFHQGGELRSTHTTLEPLDILGFRNRHSITNTKNGRRWV